MLKDEKSQVRETRLPFNTSPAKILLYSASFIALMWLLTFFIGLAAGHDDTLSSTGSFVDTFGAVNSLFTGLAFCGLIASILFQQQGLDLQRHDLEMQRIELSETRAEISGQKEQLKRQADVSSKQQFESTFFQSVNNLEQFLASNSEYEQRGYVEDTHFLSNSGRAVLKEWQNDWVRNARMNLFGEGDDVTLEQRYATTFLDLRKSKDYFFGPYFRMVYNILKLVEKSDFDDRKFYADFLRAKLTPPELTFCYLNCFTLEGEKFMKKARIFNFFKHLPTKINETDLQMIAHEIKGRQKAKFCMCLSLQVKRD